MMDLIVGDKRVVPGAMRAIPGGVEVDLSGPALLSLLDATFAGPASVELWDRGSAPRPMRVADIRMQGARTTVTLLGAGGPARMN
ncbi:hypothetical protein [Pontitalea aquivivens]|uniref:hypothetical protein n=1 Tax=Pontitalea aquivivens TaxID=3388663 RepID=UPI003971057D